MKNKRLYYTVLAAMFAALTAVLTAFVKIPFGAGGYVHPGDTLIYIAASLLPLPYAAVAAAIGGGLADLICGYALWTPFSVAIKALLTLSFTQKSEKIICKRNIIACVIAIPVTVGGYYIAESLIYGNWGALASMPWNLLQAAVSGAIYFLIAAALDKAKVKNKLFK